MGVETTFTVELDFLTLEVEEAFLEVELGL